MSSRSVFCVSVFCYCWKFLSLTTLAAITSFLSIHFVLYNDRFFQSSRIYLIRLYPLVSLSLLSYSARLLVSLSLYSRYPCHQIKQSHPIVVVVVCYSLTSLCSSPAPACPLLLFSDLLSLASLHYLGRNKFSFCSLFQLEMDPPLPPS